MLNFPDFRRCAAAFAVLLTGLTAQADFTGLTYEVVGTSDVGTTYRVYANFDDATDIAQALYAEAPFAMAITSSAGFYQDPLGALTPVGINPLLYPSFPNLAYDSWITIGQEDSDYPSAVGVVGGAAWNSADILFNTGGDFVVNDGVGGSVFATPDQVQGQPDALGRVLIA